MCGKSSLGDTILQRPSDGASEMIPSSSMISNNRRISSSIARSNSSILIGGGGGGGGTARVGISTGTGFRLTIRRALWGEGNDMESRGEECLVAGIGGRSLVTSVTGEGGTISIMGSNDFGGGTVSLPAGKTRSSGTPSPSVRRSLSILRRRDAFGDGILNVGESSSSEDDNADENDR